MGEKRLPRPGNKVLGYEAVQITVLANTKRNAFRAQVKKTTLEGHKRRFCNAALVRG